jgi:hypothetical protein
MFAGKMIENIPTDQRKHRFGQIQAAHRIFQKGGKFKSNVGIANFPF